MLDNSGVTHTGKSGEDTYSSAIATAHRYTQWMLSPFTSHLCGDIVEVGIGHGNYHETIAQFGSYFGIDLDDRSIIAAKQRFPMGNFFKADILETGFLDEILPTKADCIISFNVLEHIERDDLALQNLIDALKVGGRLMVAVPAMMSLYNDLDRLAGHYRRYCVKDFKCLLAGLPVQIEKLCYFNPIGAIGWWINRFRRHESLNSDEVNGQIELFEKYILPVSKFFDPLTRRFFGQSLICMVCRL